MNATELHELRELLKVSPTPATFTASAPIIMGRLLELVDAQREVMEAQRAYESIMELVLAKCYRARSTHFIDEYESRLDQAQATANQARQRLAELEEEK